MKMTWFAPTNPSSSSTPLLPKSLVILQRTIWRTRNLRLCISILLIPPPLWLLYIWTLLKVDDARTQTVCMFMFPSFTLYRLPFCRCFCCLHQHVTAFHKIFACLLRFFHWTTLYVTSSIQILKQLLASIYLLHFATRCIFLSNYWCYLGEAQQE